MKEVSDPFLVEFMKENLNHARHVENERMLFNSLFGALVGGALALSAQVAPDKTMVTLIIRLLLIVNLLCLFLTVRWNKVFARHWALAKKAYLEFLYGEPPAGGHSALSPDDVNRYYYFDNRRTTWFYISTARFFILYNLAIMLLLGLAHIRFMNS